MLLGVSQRKEGRKEGVHETAQVKTFLNPSKSCRHISWTNYLELLCYHLCASKRVNKSTSVPFFVFLCPAARGGGSQQGRTSKVLPTKKLSPTQMKEIHDNY